MFLVEQDPANFHEQFTLHEDKKNLKSSILVQAPRVEGHNFSENEADEGEDEDCSGYQWHPGNIDDLEYLSAQKQPVCVRERMEGPTYILPTNAYISPLSTSSSMFFSI